jgi:hypothetical protein
MGNSGNWVNFFGKFFEKIKSHLNCLKNLFIYVKMCRKIFLCGEAASKHVSNLINGRMLLDFLF